MPKWLQKKLWKYYWCVVERGRTVATAFCWQSLKSKSTFFYFLKFCLSIPEQTQLIVQCPGHFKPSHVDWRDFRRALSLVYLHSFFVKLAVQYFVKQKVVFSCAPLQGNENFWLSVMQHLCFVLFRWVVNVRLCNYIVTVCVVFVTL